ncbi:MAG: acetyl-CoA hydrolase/transferase family protein [Alphaproteobacteria bacterium]|nr:acetyl-CoA hydrolase/transferase family protein [Alphaproteobacteria bacterium]
MGHRSSSLFDFTAVLRSGDVVSWPQAIGEPLGLTHALMRQKDSLPDEVRLFVGMQVSNTLDPRNLSPFTVFGLNGAGSNRRLTAAGLIDIIPAHVSQVPDLLRRRIIPVDVVLIRARPTLESGVYSVGVICDFTQAMIQSARCVIAELDERLPLTHHDALIRAEDIDHFTLADDDEILMPDPEPSQAEIAVARKVAELIPDRSTVQLGIGTLPVAVGRALFDHRDLGIHSGVVSDVFVDLVERGVVTNAYRGLDAGLSTIGGLFGTRRLLDHADKNPAIALKSVEYTHNPAIMAQIESLYSVNSAIEIDLSGQANSEIAAGRYLGAVGGQVDFVRGARYSRNGRSIFALPSTTPDGKKSRIVVSLAHRPVTTPRSDIDVVVTEYGVAQLWGQTLSVRAERLAAIAHPDFRDELLAEVKAGASASVLRMVAAT